MNEWDSNEKRRRWRGEGRKGTGYSEWLVELLKKLEKRIKWTRLRAALCLVGSSRNGR